jgi:hypothetical protein
MKRPTLIAVALAFTTPALIWAAEPTAADRPASVRADVLEALESQATLPDHRPSLPDQASDRAREAHQTTAFGQKGAATRAAHRAERAAHENAAAAAAKRASEKAARRAGEKRQEAAAEARASEVRSGQSPSRPQRGKPF